MRVIPNHAGGFDDVVKIRLVFLQNEIHPRNAHARTQ